MDGPAGKILSFFERNRRTIGGMLAALIATNLIVFIKHAERSAPRVLGVQYTQPDGQAATATDPSSTATSGNQGTSTPATPTKLPPKIDKLGDNLNSGVGGYKPGTKVKGLGTIPLGIYGNKIRVVYYWKGDQAMNSSQYLHDTGQQGNLDEGEAFRNLVAYINKHANGGGTFMGFPFNLHGRTIEPVVVVAGKGSQQDAEAQEIVRTIKPFAAVSSHGSMSAYMCPTIASGKIFNFGTYDLGGLGGTLAQRTNGYCVPQASSFETQVEQSIAYLKWQQANVPYAGTKGPEKRAYGFIYAEYPGLIDVAPRVIARMKKEGINIVDQQSITDNTEGAAASGPNVANRFRLNGVNTIVSPDAGAPLTFTHAAAANAYTPDWFVWPCSGQDSTGMVRLYDAGEWAHASGSTCYDPEWNSDLTNSDLARRSEWYKQYAEVAPGQEPPAPTPLVYQSLLPMLVGLTNGGREVTVERFVGGMKSFSPYRYSAVKGKTTDPKFMLVTVGRQDLVGDVGKTYWDPNASNPGGAAGAYVYPEPCRYTSSMTC